MKNAFLLFATAVTTFLCSGCGVQLVQTPQGAGWDLGKIGAETWLRMNPDQGWPSTESAALYCASVIEDMAKENGWNLEEIMEATDGCSEGFVETLNSK